jgi:hypothetical protein
MAGEKMDDAPGKEASPEDEKNLYTIRMATFDKGYPFESRQGAFHSYTYLPFIGWLDPIHLNLIIFLVAIVLLVGAPLASQHRRRSRSEEDTRARLAVLREAVVAFKKETTWTIPHLAVLVQAGRLQSIPDADLYPYHQPSPAVKEGLRPDDSGGWLFDPSQADAGRMVSVNCTHTDRRGRLWSGY